MVLRESELAALQEKAESCEQRARTIISQKQIVSSCGVPNPHASIRIVGGTEAGVHEFPWQAGLVVFVDGEYFSCGGSLISEQAILTAAHCVDGLVYLF